MEGTPSQQLKKFLEPYEKEELVSMILGIANDNNEVYNLFLTKIKSDKKWCKLFVHGLSFSTTEQTLEQYYSKWGTVKEAVVLKNSNGESKGYGFVTFSTADETLNAVKVDKKKIDNRITHCNLAHKGNPKKIDLQPNNNSNNNNNDNNKNNDNNNNNRFHGSGHHNTNNGNTNNEHIKSNKNNVLTPAYRESTKDRRLFVHSLAWKTDDATLHKSFQIYGDIEEAVVIRDKSSGKSKGYGFVTFRYANSASAAVNDGQKIIDDRTTSCDFAWKHDRIHGTETSHSMMDDDNNSSLHPPSFLLSAMHNINRSLPQQPAQSFDSSQTMMKNINLPNNNNRMDPSMMSSVHNNINYNNLHQQQHLQGLLTQPNNDMLSNPQFQFGSNMNLDPSSSQGPFMTMANASIHMPQGNFQGTSIPSIMQSQSLQQQLNINNQQSRPGMVVPNNMHTPSTPPYNFQQLSPMKNLQSNFFNPTPTSGPTFNILQPPTTIPTPTMQSTFLSNVSSGQGLGPQQNLPRITIPSQMIAKTTFTNNVNNNYVNNNDNNQNSMQSAITMEAQNNFNNLQDLNIQANMPQKSKTIPSGSRRSANNSPVIGAISGTKSNNKKSTINQNNNNGNNNNNHYNNDTSGNNNNMSTTPKDKQQTQSKNNMSLAKTIGIVVGAPENKNLKRHINKNNNDDIDNNDNNDDDNINKNNNQNMSQSPKSQNLDDEGDDDVNDEDGITNK